MFDMIAPFYRHWHYNWCANQLRRTNYGHFCYSLCHCSVPKNVEERALGAPSHLAGTNYIVLTCTRLLLVSGKLSQNNEKSVPQE
jgi:hypothetical protein